MVHIYVYLDVLGICDPEINPDSTVLDLKKIVVQTAQQKNFLDIGVKALLANVEDFGLRLDDEQWQDDKPLSHYNCRDDMLLHRAGPSFFERF